MYRIEEFANAIAIQIQHLLKLNGKVIGKLYVLFAIQIQHLLKLNFLLLGV